MKLYVWRSWPGGDMYSVAAESEEEAIEAVEKYRIDRPEWRGSAPFPQKSFPVEVYEPGQVAACGIE